MAPRLPSGLALLVLITAYSTVLAITTTHHDKPEDAKPAVMATKMKEDEMASKAAAATANSTTGLEASERQKRLLPYMTFYLEHDFNRPQASYDQKYQLVPQKSVASHFLNKYNELTSQPKLKVTPFSESNALPGPFIPMRHPEAPLSEVGKVPNYSAIYDKLSQLKLQQQQNQLAQSYNNFNQEYPSYLRKPQQIVTYVPVQDSYAPPSKTLQYEQYPVRTIQLHKVKPYDVSELKAPHLDHVLPATEEEHQQYLEDQKYNTDVKKQIAKPVVIVRNKPPPKYYPEEQKLYIPNQSQKPLLIIHRRPVQKTPYYEPARYHDYQLPKYQTVENYEIEPVTPKYIDIERKPTYVTVTPNYENHAPQESPVKYQYQAESPAQYPNPQFESSFKYQFVPQEKYQHSQAQYVTPQVHYKEPHVQFEQSQETHQVKYPNHQVQYKEPQDTQVVQYKEPQVQYKDQQVQYKEPQVQYKEPQVQYKEPLQYKGPHQHQFQNSQPDYEQIKQPSVKFEPSVKYEYQEPTPIKYNPVSFVDKYVTPISTYAPQYASTATEHPQVVRAEADDPNSLSVILKKLQDTNALPHTLTADNIDNSIRTLVKILSSLKKQQKFARPIVVADDSGEYEDDNDNEAGVGIGGPHDISTLYPENTPEGGTPGKAGVDYPALSTIPQTSFNCKTQRYKGFFGDPDTNCQVWHYCDLNGGQASFLCPNGTIFSQVALTCDWWYNVKCANTPQLYVLNERLYKYILPLSPKFPEDYSGPLVDRYLAMKFQEMEEKMMKERKKNKENSSDDGEESAEVTDDADDLANEERKKIAAAAAAEAEKTSTENSSEASAENSAEANEAISKEN